LRHAEEILLLDGDSVCLVAEDRTNIVYLDWIRDDPNEEFTLTVRGDKFRQWVEECSRSMLAGDL
jgi:hypothetical protein